MSEDGEVRERKASKDKNAIDPDEKVPYPKSVFFILSTEACERFSYYGMRTILVLYLKQLLEPSYPNDKDALETTATTLYHAFIFLSYFTPIFGALLADSFLGKFRTIFYISIVYAIGQYVLALGAVPEDAWGLPSDVLSYLGLILIAFGTGGIKPCVVSFGADQFVLPNQQAEMESFFGVFYMSINFGSMVSTILTPIFRNTPCFDENECFSLAFLVPAILMSVAVVFFLIGRIGYKITIPEKNVVKDFVLTIWIGMKNKLSCSSDKEKKDHWLDYAEEDYGKRFVHEVKAVLKVCVLFLLYPLFWGLYDQQGSRWTFQATRMDGRVGSLTILPDQIQVVNAVLILILIPIFDRLIYPFFARWNMLVTPLQKIVTGGTFVGLAFIVSGLLELGLSTTYPHPPKNDQARVAFHSSLPSACTIELNLKQFDGEWTEALTIPGGQGRTVYDDKRHQLLPFEFDGDKQIDGTWQITKNENCPFENRTATRPFKVSAGESLTYYFYETKDNAVAVYDPVMPDEIDTSSSGYPYIRFYYNLPKKDIADMVPIVVGKGDMLIEGQVLDDEKVQSRDNKKVKTKAMLNFTGVTADDWKVADTIAMDDDGNVMEASGQGKFKICLFNYTVKNDYVCAFKEDVRVHDLLCDKPDKNGNVDTGPCKLDDPMEDADAEEPYKYFDFRYGGVYNLYVGWNSETEQMTVDVEVVTEPNTVHMLWLMPQYIILTMGEVMFSITSLQFAFTQAPSSMKAVVQALFLLTNAGGNALDIIIVATFGGLLPQAYEFFLFAGLMFLDMAVLSWLAVRYKYVNYDTGEGIELFDDEDDAKSNSSSRKSIDYKKEFA